MKFRCDRQRIRLRLTPKELEQLVQTRTLHEDFFMPSQQILTCSITVARQEEKLSLTLHKNTLKMIVSLDALKHLQNNQEKKYGLEQGFSGRDGQKNTLSLEVELHGN